MSLFLLLLWYSSIWNSTCCALPKIKNFFSMYSMKNLTDSFVYLGHWPSAGSFGFNTDILATNPINLSVVFGVLIDPKETWAFITWTIFAIYLHIKTNRNARGINSAIVASLGFLLIWICYFGVNLLGIGLHSYGSFTSN